MLPDITVELFTCQGNSTKLISKIMNAASIQKVKLTITKEYSGDLKSEEEETRAAPP